ncbi:hypothetical protein MNBD_GAMMA03-1494 [hydrothermal vent metagenome]|uniref:Uncharacterized protein n=1 Tax=hydrothermal vent metagenome TaxID=652676 RepID=A0A3B0W1U6_9ZZZZ
MICLIQRVSHGSVSVQQKIIGQINTGSVVLTAFQPGDSTQKPPSDYLTNIGSVTFWLEV